MPLVINSLGVGIHTHCGQKQFQETSPMLAKGWHAWFKNRDLKNYLNKMKIPVKNSIAFKIPILTAVV